MTYSSRKEARQAGETALNLLHKPDGWEIRITENLDWHVSLYKQGMSLSRCVVTGRFTVSLNSSLEDGAGEMFWSVSESFENPNEAIRAQLRAADDFIYGILTVRKAHSFAFSEGIRVHSGIVRLMGAKSSQRKFCELSHIPQSTVSTWGRSGRISSVVRFLFGALLFIKAIGGWRLFLQAMKQHNSSPQGGY